MDGYIFSIIIPTYNAEKTIASAINSALSQTFKNYEIIIVDGKSEDNTVKIIQSYAKKHQNIRWISEKDRGVYDAMNKGIVLSKGTWLYFLGSDDRLFSNDILSKVCEFFNLNDYDVVYGNVVSNRFKGLYDGIFTNAKIYEKNICHQSIFTKRTLFKYTGLFSLKYRIYGDWDHNMRWFLDPKVKKKFIDLIIADYADGGLSSNYIDFQFFADKEWNFSVYNSKNVSVTENINSVIREFESSWKQGHNKNCLKILKQAYKLFI